jgi:hypothetical protein
MTLVRSPRQFAGCSASRLAAGGAAAYEAEFTEQAVVERYLGLFERLTGVPAPGTRSAATSGEGLI